MSRHMTPPLVRVRLLVALASLAALGTTLAARPAAAQLMSTSWSGTGITYDHGGDLIYDTEPIPPPDTDPDWEPDPPEPGGYSGGFSGETTIVVTPDPRMRPVEVETIDLKEDMVLAWNLQRATIEQMVEDFIVNQVQVPKVKYLYDVAVSMERAYTSTTLLNLYVSPEAKTFSLFVFVPGHSVRCRAKLDTDSLIRGITGDPKVTIEFDVALQLSFAMTGEASRPLQLTSAFTRVMHADVAIEGRIGYTYLSTIVGFFRGESFAETAETFINGQTQSIMQQMRPVVDALNNDLSVYTKDAGLSHGTPWYDDEDHRLLLKFTTPLRRSSLLR